jgi:class 3 adenylate cyclase
MPIYMDRHYIVGATRHAIANAHEKDLAYESTYGVHFLTYWFDEARCTAFCLVDAPDKEAIEKTHAAAHGDVPHEIIEVDPNVVEAFLGKVDHPTPSDRGESGTNAHVDSAFRAIMFTDLEGSTQMNTYLGDDRAMHLLHIHNALTRNALRDFNGREVKHLGDGIMASFVSTEQAVQCAIAIQRAFARHNEGGAEPAMHLRIGLSAGEPVAEGNDLFGTAVQLAARICAHARPDQILAAPVVVEQHVGDRSLFVEADRITPRGFEKRMAVYEVKWQQQSS